MPTETPETARSFFPKEHPSIGYNRAWFNLIRAHRLLYPKVTKALRKHGMNDPIWHEILLEIGRGGPEGRLMGEIEEALYLQQYALSRHVSRLEKEGFIRREYIADGRRKQVLFLTESGQERDERIWIEYHNAIQEEFMSCMSEDEAYLLARLLIKLQPRR